MQISTISPSTFDDGKSVTLTGSGFGSSQGQVLIGGVAQNVNTWSDDEITFTTVRGSQSLGACRVDVVAGNSDTFGMSGNLKYVSSTGSDSVSYADNSISQPWQTLIHAIYNLKAGDTLLIRGGTYTPAYLMNVRDTFSSQNYGGHPSETVNCESGTGLNPVTIRNYPGELVTVDCANTLNNRWLDLDGRNYWQFHGLCFVNVGAAFYIGLNATTTHSLVQNCEFTMSAGGDNVGAISVINGNGENVTIKNNTVTGPGHSVNQNTCCLYVRGIENATIENNVLHGAPVGLYWKFGNLGSPTSISIKNNYVYDCSRYALHLNCRNAVIQNNLIGADCSPDAVVFAMAGDTGGDGNTFEHNTVASGKVQLPYNTSGGGDTLPGSLNNVIRNNIIVANVEIHPYSSVAHNTTLNYNLYGGTILNNSVTRTLSQWQSFYGQDANSVAGSPTFVGGATPAGVSGYALAGGSAGKNAASDGSDIGCNVSQVGVL